MSCSDNRRRLLPSIPLRRVSIHGNDVGYRRAGGGPLMLLIHGMAGSSRTWKEVMPLLARSFTVIDPGGQSVSARDRLYLAVGVPTLIMWGDQDPIIPVAHAHAAHETIPGSHLEIFAGAGRFLHVEEPVRFAEVLTDFVESTAAASGGGAAGANHGEPYGGYGNCAGDPDFGALQPQRLHVRMS